MLGEFMTSFQNDPLRFLRYVLGLEYADDGLEVADQVLRLLDSQRPFRDQLVALEQVSQD